MKYWLMKSEPETFSIDDLAARKVEPWDGVRNYQARNFMREMAVGDGVFFYHSNARPPGIVGLAEVAKAAYPDPTQFDGQSDYFDARSTVDHPRWDLVEVRFKEKFAQMITLETLKEHEALSEMVLVQKGNRLSVMPVTKAQWDCILSLAVRGNR